MKKIATTLARWGAASAVVSLLAVLAGCGSNADAEDAMHPAVDTTPGKGRLMVRDRPERLENLVMMLRSEEPPVASEEFAIDEARIELRVSTLRETHLALRADHTEMRLLSDATPQVPTVPAGA